MKTALISLFAAALVTGSALPAQTTRLVDPLDPAYRQLELLIDGGLIDRLSLAQKPLSRAAIGRAVDEATRRLAEREGRLAGPALAGSPRDGEAKRDRVVFYRELITSLRERLELPDSSVNAERALRFAPIRALSVDLTGTDQPSRIVPRNNGIGAIDAILNPLLAYREGRPSIYGTAALLESNHTLEAKYVAISATPRLSLAAPRDSERRADLTIQELQFRARLRNVALDVGREYVVWGQGRDVGLLNSTNSPPLDLVRLSGEDPFGLPFFLRHLGPTRFSVFYADLGGDQNYPHPYLVGYQFNILPSSTLELGASVYTKSGGIGAPRATWSARLIDLVPFLDASAFNNAVGLRGLFEFSDHYSGFDGRLRIPSLETNFYWDVLLNDFDVRRLRSVFWEDAGHVLGIDLPPLTPSGRLRASLEYHHTGIRYYEHHQFTSGQTLHRVVTGDPLGPDAQGVYANIDHWASPQRQLSVQFALERRSNDQYALVDTPRFKFEKTAVRPKEWQGRAVATWQFMPRRSELGGLAQFGYARTRNFNFLEGDSRNGFLGRVQLQYRFQ